MKSMIKRISACFIVCVMILAVCGGINRASAYELTETAEGRVLKISTAELHDTWLENRKCEHLIIFGKLAKSVLWYLEDVAEYCETLDMSDLDIDVIPHQSFIENVNLRKVILPKNLKEIEPVCFSRCYNLETVVLPESLREIGHGSFMVCPKLKMEVPSNIRCKENVFDRSPGVTIVETESEPICGCWTRVWQWINDFKEKTL